MRRTKSEVLRQGIVNVSAFMIHFVKFNPLLIQLLFQYIVKVRIKKKKLNTLVFSFVTGIIHSQFSNFC